MDLPSESLPAPTAGAADRAMTQPAATQPAAATGFLPGPGPAAFELSLHDDEVADTAGSGVFLQLMVVSATSLLLHTLLLVALVLISFDVVSQQQVQFVSLPPRDLDTSPPVEVELSQEIQVATPQAAELFSSLPISAASLGGSGQGVGSGLSAAIASAAPALDHSLIAKAAGPQLQIDAPTIGLLDAVTAIETIADGEVKGEARDIVEGYQEALDRLAQELLWMLDEGPTLVVWCFDQSTSMKDDQREIHNRIETVYQQLGLDGRSRNGALQTAITSYGENFVDHTGRKPVADLDLIRQAIESIPNDESGIENMCSAVGQAIFSYRDWGRRGRQMALVLVSDESGSDQDNDQFLEKAIAMAKQAKCRVYVLGRESVFGSPYAYIRWRHPQTQRPHWLQIDRGPETGFPELLQTDGIRRRYDAFSAGFGPYAQARLAYETNGIFFMLPSVEDDLVGAYKYRYDMEALRPYRPDLRAAQQILASRGEHPLRMLIWQVIQDLNPYQERARNIVELRVSFSLAPAEFITQARQEQTKAKLQLQYMARAEKALLEGAKWRQQEADPRWQANYDLILAQLIAYQARIWEYGVALDAFIEKPKQAEPRRGQQVLHSWDIRNVAEIRTEEASPSIDRARQLFAALIKEHPGSPWAARAQWELDRGFGIDLHPYYDQPYHQVADPSPPPKL